MLQNEKNTIIGIDKREVAAPQDCGDEHLCLRQISETEYELSIREYEILGDISDYCDDDGEENIPDIIDGKKVKLGEGWIFVLGGDLVIQKDHIVPMIFSVPNFNNISDFLDEFDWKTHRDSKPYNEIFDEIKRLISKSNTGLTT
jgi:hypothetical protein